MMYSLLSYELQFDLLTCFCNVLFSTASKCPSCSHTINDSFLITKKGSLRQASSLFNCSCLLGEEHFCRKMKPTVSSDTQRCSTAKACIANHSLGMVDRTPRSRGTCCKIGTIVWHFSQRGLIGTSDLLQLAIQNLRDQTSCTIE